jgi:hypothetical protein
VLIRELNWTERALDSGSSLVTPPVMINTEFGRGLVVTLWAGEGILRKNVRFSSSRQSLSLIRVCVCDSDLRHFQTNHI